MTKDPNNCNSMKEVREGVDALDRELVRLLVRRQGYMDAAARIEDVVSKVLAEAHKQGLNPKIAEPVWRRLIERCIAHEFDEWDRIREEARKSA